jgi:hypothetical protein
MNLKRILVPGLAISLVAVIVGVVIANRKVAPPIALTRVTQPTTTPAISESTPPVKTPSAETKPEVQPPPAEAPAIAQSQKVAAQTAPPANANGPLQDPTARIALSFVGTDPLAEAYWTDAIFDPSLPDEERADLMEDLNEDGLSDPQHPGLQDLPLIVNRIRMIEDIAPYADDFMLEHLGEADKDLRNMLAGKPVQ